MRSVHVPKQSNCRKLGFERLETRNLLSVSVSLASRAVAISETPSGSSGVAAISDDGRFVLFSSNAPNVIAGVQASPDFYNLYRRDRTSGETILVSFDINGFGGANGDCIDAKLSADGDVVVFRSSATNLSPLDNDSAVDVYTRRISTGQTELVSVNQFGTGGAGIDCTDFDISADGNAIAFSTKSGGIHALDLNGYSDVFVRRIDLQTTMLISINESATNEGHGDSFAPQISDDGTIVGFVSWGRLMSELDQNSHLDVYVRDMSSEDTRLVSISADQSAAGNGDSPAFSMSSDGNRIAFVSEAANLNALDSDNQRDVYVRYLDSASTELVSVSADGSSSANGWCQQPLISGDGKVVLFVSEATNLHPLDSVQGGDIFARNLESGATSLVSVRHNNFGGANFYFYSSFTISHDGRFVAFSVESVGIHPLDADTYEDFETYDVFVRDLWENETRIVSTNSAGTANGNDTSGGPRISADGTVVAFNSAATDLVVGDDNNFGDAFVWDGTTGATSLVSQSHGGQGGGTANGPSWTAVDSMSTDGRYVVFTSRATDIVDGVEYQVPQAPSNIFRFDRLTGQNELVSANRFGTGGGNGDSESPQISADGRIVVFRSRSNNLADRAGSGEHNIFIRDMESGTTTLVSEFRGTYSSGTNGGARVSKDGKVVTFLSNTRGTHPLKTGTTIDVFAYNLDTKAFHYVTLAANGQRGGNDQSYIGDISADGSVIVFMSEATNLHPLDTDGREDVYARNLITGELHLVSVNLTGTGGGNRDSRDMAISDDGTRVAFVSEATNLSPIDLVEGPDIYVRDLSDGTTQLVSVNSTGDGGTNSDGNAYLQMSANGKVLVWGGRRVFARDLETNSTELVSNSSNFDTVISDDGDVIAFSGGAENVNLFQHDPAQEIRGVYARKRSAGVTELISVKTNTSELGDGPSHRPAISGDGRVVAFYSAATDLVENDWNRQDDVFVAEVSWNPRSLAGDYNQDRVVDSADYSVWRDALGTTKLVPYFGADGDGDGTVDQDDYLVWKANFGRVLGAGSTGQGAGSQSASEVASRAVGNAAMDKSSPKVAEEQFADERRSDGTRAVRWRRGLELLGRGVDFDRTRNKPPADPEAGDHAFASVRSRDLALLAWRSVAWARWQGSRGEFAAATDAGIHSQDVDEADGVFEALGSGTLRLGTR